MIILSAALLDAQSNDVIDGILGQEQISCGNGAYLALTAAGEISEGTLPEEAFEILRQRNLIKEKRRPGDAMSLGEFSLALMKSFSLPGGLMYTLFPSPRYASRELGYLGYVSRDAGAYRTLSGSEALSLAGKIAREKGGAE